MEIVRVRLIDSDEAEGCEEAPVLILNALKEIKNKENGVEIEFDRFHLEEIHVDLGNIDEANHLIFENSKEIFEKNSKAFFIGGDHSISYSILKGFDKVQEGGLLIAFDGRCDCSLEGGNGGWLRKLIDEGFDGRRIILVGVRDLSMGDRDYLKENGVVIIGMDVLQEDREGVCDLIMERAKDSEGFYLSLDVRVLDPAFAPGVNDLEPGGLSSRELIYFVKRLSLLENFRGGDIVEVNPKKDINGMSVKLAGRLLGEMV